jgi:hypothetical protein
MPQTVSSSPVSTQSVPAVPSGLDLASLERGIATSPFLAKVIVVGLPLLGILAALWLHVPLFTSLVAGSFLFGAALSLHKALATFTGRLLRLLVVARLVFALVVGVLLLYTSGSVWASLVSSTLLWLVTDRLLGRRALRDLWKATQRAE